MGKIINITQLTENRFLNMYDLEIEDKNGGHRPYHVSSRARCIEELKLSTRENKPDGVIIYALYGEQQEQVVLIRQYRYSIGSYIYEFPAGLIDEGEDFQTAGMRELKEETGLTFHPINVDPIYSKPYFTTIGMTDESCAAVYGRADGEISYKEQEETEEIEVVLADRKEVLRILREENVSLMCAYMMMHFLHADPKNPFAFLNVPVI